MPNTRRNRSSSTSTATSGRSLLLTDRNRRASASPLDSLLPVENSAGRPRSSLPSQRGRDSRASARRGSGTRSIRRRRSYTLSGRPHKLRSLRRRPQRPRRRAAPNGRSPVRTLPSRPPACRPTGPASTCKRCGPGTLTDRRHRLAPLRPWPIWKGPPRRRSEPRARPRIRPQASDRSQPFKRPRRHRPQRRQHPSRHRPRRSRLSSRNPRRAGSIVHPLGRARSRLPPRRQHPHRVTKPRRPSTPRNLRHPPRPATFHSSERGTP